MIRFALEEDIDSIYDLGSIFNSNFKNTYNINEYLKNNNYVILINEDNVVNAFLIVYKNIDYYELEFIVVDKKARKQGIANNLLNYFITNFTKENDIILLEVAENNIVAINLYKKFQFEVINKRKKYYQGIDAYIMKRVV